MCTFVILYKLLNDYPVVALHNRYLGQNTREKPPQCIGEGVYCPIDIESQGTWMGFNRDGLFLAITNQETQTMNRPNRSRGLLALDLLRDCSTAREAKDCLMDPFVRPRYRSGNFLVADSEDAWHILWDNVTKAWGLPKGPYAVGVVTRYPGIEMSERAEKLGPDSDRRRRRAFQLLREFNPSSIDEVLEKMKQVSGDHAYDKTTSSICWHSLGFRQTSSTIMAVGEDPELSRVLYCPGNACEKPFKEYPVSFD